MECRGIDDGPHEVVVTREKCYPGAEPKQGDCERTVLKRELCGSGGPHHPCGRFEMEEPEQEESRETKPYDIVEVRTKCRRNSRMPGCTVEELKRESCSAAGCRQITDGRRQIHVIREICEIGSEGPVCKKAFWDKWFSNDNTHIANASPWVIMANVNKDRKYATSINLSGGGKGYTLSVGQEYEWERVDKTGLTRIDPAKEKSFHVTGNPLYLTIMAKMPNGKLKVLDNARPIESDKSVIVDKTGHVKNAKYGTIWQPE